MKGRSAQDIVMQRCLALLTCLLRGPAHPDLLKAILRGFADSYADPTEKSISRQYEEDLRRLREWFGCELEYDRKKNVWCMKSIQNAPFDLPADALRGLAFLEATFSGRSAPMSVEVITLIDAISRLMPEERRTELRKQRGLLELKLDQRDRDVISDEVLDKTRQATMDHRTIEFDYRANRPDGITVRHRAEPYRTFFDEGHYYLEAYCIETRSPNGRHSFNKMARYRIGRISNLSVLPGKFIPRSYLPTTELTYELSPEVARMGVTIHIPQSEIEMREDGSAVVRAQTTELFFDLRKLLHYGANCRVTGGTEAVREMKKIVQGMADLYGVD